MSVSLASVKTVINKNINVQQSEKLLNTLFNFSENIPDNIKNCKKDDLLLKIKNKKEEVVFDSLKENIYLFPTVLRRIKDTLFGDSKGIRFTIYPPGVLIKESVTVKNLLEDCSVYYFLFKYDINGETGTINKNYKYRDVLVCQNTISNNATLENLPILYKNLTDTSYLGLNKKMHSGFKITTDTEKKSILNPPQYVSGLGGEKKDSIFKNHETRIIICAQVF